MSPFLKSYSTNSKQISNAKGIELNLRKSKTMIMMMMSLGTISM